MRRKYEHRAQHKVRTQQREGVGRIDVECGREGGGCRGGVYCIVYIYCRESVERCSRVAW